MSSGAPIRADGNGDSNASGNASASASAPVAEAGSFAAVLSSVAGGLRATVSGERVSCSAPPLRAAPSRKPSPCPSGMGEYKSRCSVSSPSFLTSTNVFLRRTVAVTTKLARARHSRPKAVPQKAQRCRGSSPIRPCRRQLQHRASRARALGRTVPCGSASVIACSVQAGGSAAGFKLAGGSAAALVQSRRAKSPCRGSSRSPNRAAVLVGCESGTPTR